MSKANYRNKPKTNAQIRSAALRKQRAASQQVKTSGGGLREFGKDLKRSLNALDEKIDNAIIGSMVTGVGERVARKVVRRPKPEKTGAAEARVPMPRKGETIEVDHDTGIGRVTKYQKPIKMKKYKKKIKMKKYKRSAKPLSDKDSRTKTKKTVRERMYRTDI